VEKITLNQRVHLDIVLKFQVRPRIPLGPDRLEALSYAGGEAAAK
jgi:hypothetical protein